MYNNVCLNFFSTARPKDTFIYIKFKMFVASEIFIFVMINFSLEKKDVKIENMRIRA